LKYTPDDSSVFRRRGCAARAREPLDFTARTLTWRSRSSSRSSSTSCGNAVRLGCGRSSCRAGLVEWAEAKLDGPIIYVFWRGKCCLYVGKGITSRRLRNYRKSAYLLQATRVEVFEITHRSQLACAECLATHLFRPRDNRVKAAKVKWGKSCPICKQHDAVRSELRDLFRMR
jgi:hypothetical protein